MERGAGVRVLIVAPDSPGINALPEVRLVQSWHHTSTLNGAVTAEDIFRACQETAFDIIHFAAHGGVDGVQLSGGALFSREDIAQVARLKETQELFFNSCTTGALASYAVRHGVRTAISAETELEDGDAWKLAGAFYSARRNGKAADPVGAYVIADAGDGDYALHVSPTYVQELQRAAALVVAQPHDTLVISRQLAVTFALGVLGASAVLSLLINMLAGRI